MHEIQTRPLRRATSMLAAAVILGAASLFGASPAFAVGAIAVDAAPGSSASEVGYGIGHGATRAQAERRALHTCRRQGNRSCKVAVWYKVCGAYAKSRQRYGYGYGNSLDSAETHALNGCNNRRCRIAVSDCDPDAVGDE